MICHIIAPFCRLLYRIIVLNDCNLKICSFDRLSNSLYSRSFIFRATVTLFSFVLAARSLLNHLLLLLHLLDFNEFGLGSPVLKRWNHCLNSSATSHIYRIIADLLFRLPVYLSASQSLFILILEHSILTRKRFGFVLILTDNIVASLSKIVFDSVGVTICTSKLISCQSFLSAGHFGWEW